MNLMTVAVHALQDATVRGDATGELVDISMSCPAVATLAFLDEPA